MVMAITQEDIENGEFRLHINNGVLAIVTGKQIGRAHV